MKELPTVAGGFGVALADPGHLFRTWSSKGAGKSAQRHYRCEAVAEIAALPVADLMAPDSALFLWCTWPLIFTAEEIMTAWGFRYSGLAWVWIKHNPITDKFAFGLGLGGTRKNCEVCLLARRGSPRLLNRSTRDFILAPKREHSRKPDEQYGLIESLFPGPYVELYARQRWPKWESWGDQLPQKGEDHGNRSLVRHDGRASPPLGHPRG